VRGQSKLPIPVPLVIFESSMVGFWLKLQQTPRSVIAVPPAFVIDPPQEAVVLVIFLTAEIATMGIVFSI